MRRGARIAVALGLAVLAATGCASLAGIEDLQLTGSADGGADGGPASGDGASDATGSSSGGEGGRDGAPDGAGGDGGGACSTGQIRCSGNGVQTCGGNGQWTAPAACVNQTCVAGACVGMCAPGQTHPVPCGNCGTDTQTCTTAGTWQGSGTCTGQGCAPGATQACDTYGSQTCTATCTWGACSCPAAPTCTPGQTQCASGGVATCDACGQVGSPVACASGTCSGGVCTGSCTNGDTQCSGNGVQTCSGGMWGAPVACVSSTCSGGACVGSCSPGQTNPVSCGNCGTDTQTCGAGGVWQNGACSGQGPCAHGATQPCNTYGTETCGPTCAWGACSCPSSPACTPGSKKCSGSSVQTCDACGQWGSPVSCGALMTCTGSGTCVAAGTDCPGSFLLCDGFESDSIDTTTKWEAPNCGSGTSMGIGTTAHWGSYSLEVQVAQVFDGSYVACTLGTRQASIFASTPMYFRAWIYFQNGLPGTDNEFFITVQSSANGDSASGGMGINQTGQYLSGVSNSGGYDFKGTASSSQPLFPNSWNCVELEIDTDYATYPNGQMQAWDSNTSTTPDPQLSGTAKLQSLVAADFGITYDGPALPATIFIDDIAISNSYIPCGQ